MRGQGLAHQGRGQTSTWVVPIDRRVRPLLSLYIGLFPNYRAAGQAIGVGKDTIAKYASESSHMAYDVFRRMVDVTRSRSTKKAIRLLYGRRGLDGLVVDVRAKNGGQVDNVMYHLNDGVCRLLKEFLALHSNRGQAARALDLNPRTLKAYTNGQIHFFPRTRFWKMVDLLRANGRTEADLLACAGTKSWGDLLRERSRAETLFNEKEQLLERLVELLAEGRQDLKTRFRPVYNACRRHYGSLGPAVDAAMEHMAASAEKRVRRLIEQGLPQEARRVITQFEQALRSYSGRARARVHAARKGSKLDWQKKVVEYVQVKDRLKKLVLREGQFGGGSGLENETERLRFLYPYLGHFKIYVPERSFSSGDLIFHPVFGLGRVVEIIRRGQMKVLFKPSVGPKLLAFHPTEN